MPSSLVQQYSSVVVNQNRSADDLFSAEAEFEGYMQEFHLPADYRRGTESGELRYPDMSGIQLLVMIADDHARHAAFDYEVQYQVFGLGWVSVTSGVAIGAPTDGETWMTAYFDEPVPIDAVRASSRWRIIFGSGRPLGNGSEVYDVVVPYANGEANALGTRVVVDLTMGEPYHFIHNGLNAFLYLDPADGEVYFSYEQGVTDFLITSPNPLALPHFDNGYDHDGTLITGASGAAAFCFRVLGTTAEDGIDFLGNQYRSIVTRNGANNISTAQGADPDSYWLSKPNPSKFAIENLYFDMRRPGSTTYGRTNMVPNPIPASATGFASDSTFYINPADGGHGFITDADGLPAYRFITDASPGQQGVRVASLNGVTFKQGVTYYFVVQARANSAGLAVLFFGNGATDVGNNTSTIALTSTWQTFAKSWTPSADRTTVTFGMKSPSAGAANTFYMRHLLVAPSGTQPEYLDGSMPDHIWSDVPNGSASYELILPSAEDVATVVDRVVIDPMTPGAYFNVYYTDEGDPGENEDQWENKLWTRIPQTYRMERRETHVFPEPIRAKYLKIEFSHLQARYYAPGNWQQSIRYKKHPKWVLDYFLARMQVDTFLAERVTVIYDAIDLAYNYYLDDLGQEPQTTVDVNNTALTQVTSFLSDRTDVSDRIDANTLDRLNLALEPYREHPALRGYATTLLGQYARQTVDTTADYAVEGARIGADTTPDVSSLNRDRVVIEQNYPVMFFFLTCRHKYREVEARLSHDRAYFVGVREIAFLRDNYMTAFDTTTYIEPNADTLNIERNEFI